VCGYVNVNETWKEQTSVEWIQMWCDAKRLLDLYLGMRGRN